MHSQDKGTKRARTQQQDGAGALDNLPGREQLLLAAPELETDRTIQIDVGSLGGDSFKIILDELVRLQGRIRRRRRKCKILDEPALLLKDLVDIFVNASRAKKLHRPEYSKLQG